MNYLTKFIYNNHKRIKTIRIRTLHVLLKNLWKCCEDPLIRMDLYYARDLLKKECYEINNIPVIKVIDNTIITEVSNSFVNKVLSGYLTARNKKTYCYNIINLAYYTVNGIPKLTAPIPINITLKLIKILDMSIIPDISEICGDCFVNCITGKYTQEKRLVKKLMSNYGTFLEIIE